MIYSTVIREKYKDVGEFIDLSLARAQTNASLTWYCQQQELIQHLKQQS